jgi:hypothetical protein
VQLFVEDAFLVKSFTLSSELERLNGGNCSEGIRRGSEFCGASLDKEGSKVRGIGHVVVCNEPELVTLEQLLFELNSDAEFWRIN